jgi:hypothetical protein
MQWSRATCEQGRTPVQTPFWQVVPPVHARLHAPQWALLLRRSISQPSPALLLQLPKLVLQAPTPQVPPRQPATALAGVEQTVPQVPQFDVLESRFASQPSLELLLQFPKPELQAPGTQVPLLHARVPLG